MEGVEEQRQVAVTELAGALLVSNTDGRQLLEQQGKIVDYDVRANSACGSGTLDQPDVELL